MTTRLLRSSADIQAELDFARPMTDAGIPGHTFPPYASARVVERVLEWVLCERATPPSRMAGHWDEVPWM